MVGAVNRLKPGVLPNQLHKTQCISSLNSDRLQIPAVTSEPFLKSFVPSQTLHIAHTALVPWQLGHIKAVRHRVQCPFTLQSKHFPKHACRPGFSPAILSMSFKADLGYTLALPSPGGFEAVPALHRGRLWSRSGLCYWPPLCQRDLLFLWPWQGQEYIIMVHSFPSRNVCSGLRSGKTLSTYWSWAITLLNSTAIKFHFV